MALHLPQLLRKTRELMRVAARRIEIARGIVSKTCIEEIRTIFVDSRHAQAVLSFVLYTVTWRDHFVFKETYSSAFSHIARVIQRASPTNAARIALRLR